MANGAHNGVARVNVVASRRHAKRYLCELGALQQRAGAPGPTTVCHHRPCANWSGPRACSQRARDRACAVHSRCVDECGYGVVCARVRRSCYASREAVAAQWCPAWCDRLVCQRWHHATAASMSGWNARSMCHIIVNNPHHGHITVKSRLMRNRVLEARPGLDRVADGVWGVCGQYPAMVLRSHAISRNLAR